MRKINVTIPLTKVETKAESLSLQKKKKKNEIKPDCH